MKRVGCIALLLIVGFLLGACSGGTDIEVGGAGDFPGQKEGPKLDDDDDQPPDPPPPDPGPTQEPTPTPRPGPTWTRTPTPRPAPTWTPTPEPAVPAISVTIEGGQICNNRCIDYGSHVDFCIRSNFNTTVELSVYSVDTGQEFNLETWKLSNGKQCVLKDLPMSAPYGRNELRVHSFDGPSHSLSFCVDDC